jgi:hypothetical protein
MVVISPGASESSDGGAKTTEELAGEDVVVIGL